MSTIPLEIVGKQPPNCPRDPTRARSLKGAGKRTEVRKLLRVLADDVMNAETSVAHRAQAARAYDALLGRLRAMEGKPDPRPVDTTKLKPARRPGAPGNTPAFEE